MYAKYVVTRRLMTSDNDRCMRNMSLLGGKGLQIMTDVCEICRY